MDNLNTLISENYVRNLSVDILNVPKNLIFKLEKNNIRTIGKLIDSINGREFYQIKEILPEDRRGLRFEIQKLFGSLIQLNEKGKYTFKVNENNKIVYDSSSIKTLNLPTRAYNALMRAGISTIHDLIVTYGKGELSKIDYIGEEIEKIIVDFIESTQLKNNSPTMKSILVRDGTPISDLSLPPRIINVLNRSHIYYIGRLIQIISKDEIEGIRNMGEKSVKEIKKAVMMYFDIEVFDVEKMAELLGNNKVKTKKEEKYNNEISISLNALGLNNSINGSLSKAGIKTIEDLLNSLKSNALLRVKGLGRIKIAEIEGAISKYLNLDIKNIKDDGKLLEETLTFRYTSLLVLTPKVSRESIDKLLLSNKVSSLKDLFSNLGQLESSILKKEENDWLVTLKKYSPERIIAKLIDQKYKFINSQIVKGKLHPDSQYNGEPLSFWLGFDQKNLNVLKLLTNISMRNSLAFEIEEILAHCDSRDIDILIHRFSNNNKQTFQEIGERYSLTRERIRQITQKAIKKINKNLKKDNYIYLHSAILFGNELGGRLSLLKWEKELSYRGILGQLSENVVKKSQKKLSAFDLLEVLASVKFEHLFEIPKFINKVYEAKGRSIYASKALGDVTVSNKRKVLRNLIHTGGIELEEAAHLLSLSLKNTKEFFDEEKFIEVDKYWYTSTSMEYPRSPIRNAGVKMLGVVNPISLSEFSSGVRRHISRFYEALVPKKTLIYHLEKLGFIVDKESVTFDGPITPKYSESEKIFSRMIDTSNQVLTYSEIVEEFLENSLSIPTVSKILSSSPIVKKLELGLYSRIGINNDWEEIENAKDRVARVDSDVEISHGLDGIIRYCINVNSWGKTTGVINVNKLPDLGGDWQILLDGSELGLANMNEALIWGLLPTFNYLGIEIKDRIEIAFNTFNKTLEVRKLND